MLLHAFTLHQPKVEENCAILWGVIHILNAFGEAGPQLIMRANKLSLYWSDRVLLPTIINMKKKDNYFGSSVEEGFQK